MTPLKKHIKPIETFERECRSLLGHPFTLFLFSYAFLVQSFSSVVSFPDNFSWINRFSLFYCGNAFAWISSYLFLGRFVWFTTVRNIPIFFSCMVFALTLVTIQMVSIHLIAQAEGGGMSIFFGVVSYLILDSLFVVILLLFFKDYIYHHGATDPKMLPFWGPVKLNDQPLNDLLPYDVQGKILEMQSFNQYVSITTNKGKHDLRMSLKEAIENIDGNSGFRVHRSIWLNSEQINKLTYKNGNPHLKLNDGRTLPVGRNKVAQLKEFLSVAMS